MSQRIRLPRTNVEWDIETSDRYGQTRLTASVVVNGQRCASSSSVENLRLELDDRYGDFVAEDTLRSLEREVGRLVVRGAR